MKIIKRTKWTLKVVCKDCKAELKIEGSDVRYGDFGIGYGDDHDYKYYVNCANCHAVVSLKDNLLLENIKDGAEAKYRRAGAAAYHRRKKSKKS